MALVPYRLMDLSLNGFFHTTAFKLTLTGPNGSTSYIDSVFALVPPTVISFTVTPDTLPIGGGVDTLKWSSLDATSCHN